MGKPKLESLKAEDLQLSKQLDHMEYTSEKLTTELREMKLGSIHLNKVIRTTQNNIEDLTVDLEETNMKITEKKRLIKDLETSLAELTSRLKESKDSFKTLMTDRRNFQLKMQLELDNRVKQNDKLAEDYYSLIQQIFAMKSDFNAVYQQQIELEQTLRSLRQVEFLQERFIRCLKEYYKYRNLFFCAEIADLNAEQNAAEEYIEGIKNGMETALSKMSSFLTKMIEGSLFKQLKEKELEAIDPPENQKFQDFENQAESKQEDLSKPSIFVTQHDNSFATPQNLSHFKILPPISVNSQSGDDSLVNPTNNTLSVC